MTNRPHRLEATVIALALAAGVLPSAVSAQGIPVIDSTSILERALQHSETLAKHVEQVGKLTEQIQTLEKQLAEAKRLYESFNQVTNANDIASLLARDEFRRYLPKEFAEVERIIKGSGGEGGTLGGLVDGYLADNRYYTGTGTMGSEEFYRRELDRIARAAGTKHSIGQQVFDTAARRVDELEKLRTRITSTTTAAEKLDLSNRLQAETALLQNEVLRLQGLGMVQQARADMDTQRERERRQKLADEMKAAAQ